MVSSTNIFKEKNENEVGKTPKNTKTHHELLHTQGESSGVKQNLPLLGEEAQYLFHHDHKVLRQKFVRLWEGRMSKEWTLTESHQWGEFEISENQNYCIYFIQDNHLHLIDFCDSFLDEVQNPPRSGNDHMYFIKKKEVGAGGVTTTENYVQCTKDPLEGVDELTRFVQSHDVVAEVCSTCGCHYLDSTHVFADLDAYLADLQGQFSGGHYDQSWEEQNI